LDLEVAAGAHRVSQRDRVARGIEAHGQPPRGDRVRGEGYRVEYILERLDAVQTHVDRLAVRQGDPEVTPRDRVHPGASVQGREGGDRLQVRHVHQRAFGRPDAVATMEVLQLRGRGEPGEGRGVELVAALSTGELGVLEARDRVDHAGRTSGIGQSER